MISRTKHLSIIREDLGDCRRCPLHKSRKNIVFGRGSADAQLMFVGEGPGQEEDEQGLPFVGRAGQLLDKMIAAMGYHRDAVYIANIVKCRPTTKDGFNRMAAPEETSKCEPFLHSQISAINPTVIITLGNLATRTLLKTDAGITSLRGKWQKYKETPVMPTFHPAFLLRTPAGKAYTWRDLKKVMEFLKKSHP